MTGSVEFINREKNNIKLTKRFVGLTTDQINALRDSDSPFTIIATGANSANTFKLSLKKTPEEGCVGYSSYSSERKEFTWILPEDTYYRVTESNYAVNGFTTAIDVDIDSQYGSYNMYNGQPDSFEIHLNNARNRTFTVENTYAIITVPMTIKLTVANDTEEDRATDFPVTLKVTTPDGSDPNLSQFAAMLTANELTSDINFVTDPVTGMTDTITFNMKHSGEITLPMIEGYQVDIVETSHPGYTTQIVASGDLGEFSDKVAKDNYVLEKMPDYAVTIELINVRAVPLPATGGLGKTPIYALGAVLILFSIVCIPDGKHKKENRN